MHRARFPIVAPASVIRLQENTQVHDHYWEQLNELDRQETARRAGCIYRPQSDSFAIRLLSSEYTVDPTERTIRSHTNASDPRSAGYLEQLCLLAYLVTARDLPLSGTLVSPERLEAGGFFFRGSHRLPVERLEETFGRNPRLLRETGRLFDAQERTFGDAAIELLVLPRIPITLIIWASDEEFPARASILFDQTAPAHLPLDVLYAAATLTIKSVVSAADSKS